MSRLPEGWAEASFAAVADVQLGKMLDRARNRGEPTPYLRNINVRWGSFDLSDVASMRMTLDERAAFCIQDGDLMVCEGGEPGRAAVWRDGPTNVAFQKALMRVRPAHDVETDFLQRWLTVAAANGMLEQHFTGTTIKHLPQNVLRGLVLPIAPAAEQRRIVAKLNALTARMGHARADLDRIPGLAARYKLSLLRKALRGELTETWRQQTEPEPTADFLKRTPPPQQGRGGREATTEVVPGQAALSVNHPGTPAPQGWAWTSLLRIARQETGHTPSRSVATYWGGEIPWIGIRDAGAHHGRTITDTLQTITEEGLANSSARLLPARTVCLSRTASVGYVTIMARPMATSQDFATWTCSEALVPEFLMYALMAEGDDIRAFGEGSTHTTIYFPAIRALHICLPSPEEQHEIVQRVRAGLAEIDRLAAEASAARRLLDRLDQAILAKAFRGELVAQDPADEPANVLLERIRAERAAAPKAKRRGRAVAA